MTTRVPAFLSLLLLLAAAAGADPGYAVDVKFPIVVDYRVLEDALGATSDAGARTWQTDDGCHSARLDELRVKRAGDRVRISAKGKARAGFPIWRFCLFSVGWDGYLDTLVTPEVGADWRLRFQNVSSELFDRNHGRSAVANRIWDLVKGGQESELRRFSLDLHPPADEARSVIRDCVGSAQAEPVIAAVESMRPVATRVDDDGVQVDVLMDVPRREGVPQPIVPEEPLRPEEMQRVQDALERFDAFLVFVIKDLGLLTPDTRVRDDLFGLLLESRRQLLAALAGEGTPTGDPVRELFLADWDRLRAIVREAGARGQLKDHGLRYLTFLAAGDALAALDAVGPWLDLEVSADGLRRLARLLEPDYAGDPLLYSEAADPTLKDLFHFHEPDVPDAPPPPPDESGLWGWIAPRPAYAAAAEAGTPAARSLDRWVPSNDDLDAYREAVAHLLDGTATRTAATETVDGRFGALYGHLVRAVAWQESCWRQYVRKNGKVTFLLSKTGDIGIMQVNRRVWRGFFDLQKLEWNVAYNAGAGAEILAQLLVRYGSREAGSVLDNAARATYCAYNGGPDAYRRYREARVPRSQRAVDEAFWNKYRAMAAGKALDYVLCVESWGSGSTRLSTAGPPSGETFCRSARRSDATRMSPSRHAAMPSRPRASRV